jgi:hypothetical protein
MKPARQQVVGSLLLALIVSPIRALPILYRK